MALAVIVMLVGAPVLLTAPAAAAKAGGCTIVGTSGDDVLTGTAGDDVICGLGGDDTISGRGGQDLLRGGGGDDVVRGGPGDDRVAGGRGDDRVFGDGGDDVVRGDAGDDEVVGGPGDDRLGGFRGADQVMADGDAGRSVDDVRCGPGPDTVSADPADRVRRDCEKVAQNDPPTDITLVPSSVSENEPPGSDVGNLTAVDPDAGDSHVFSLVPGAGSADNASFRVDGDSLESAIGFDFETRSSYSVRLRATDEAGEVTEKAFTVTVTDANDPPVAVDDGAEGTEDTQLDLPVSGAGSPAVNDTDQDGDAIVVSAVSNPTGGTVSISGGQVHFVPATNLCGNDVGTFGYTASDGGGGTDTGTVTVDLACVDDDPDAVDDSPTVAEDSGVTTFDVLANDSDPENDPIAVTGVTQPTNGTVTFTPADVAYTPDPDYCNAPGAAPDDTFTYTVTGGGTATVSVTVTCANDAPTAVDDARTTGEDTPLSDPVTGAGSPAANDIDVDGDTLTVTSASNAVGGTVAIASGQVTFTPTANTCSPAPASYDYVVSDGNGGTDTGTVTIDVTCVNDPPVANDDARTVGEDSGPTTFGTLLVNDTDAESDPITVTAASDPANGTTTFTATDVTYTPDPDFCGADSFTYTVNGGDTATVSVTVTCVDDAPVADDDAATVTEDDPATAVDVLADDDDVEGDPITISSAGDPANGTVVLTGGTAGAHTGLTYEPDPDYCNDPPGTTPDTFTYTVNGGDTATVSVVVTCVDDDPTAVDDTATATLNGPATPVDVLANDDNDDGGPMAIASASDPANGTVVLTGGTPGNHTALTYEPDPGYCNTDPVGPADTFTYTITPGGDTATVSMTVTCDVPPVGVDDLATVAEDDPATAVDVLANDTDADGGPKVITAATDPAEGTVVLTGGTSGAHTGLTYEPDPDYCNDPGEATEDTFDYTLNGGDTATVSVIVTCVDDAPVANDDAATVAEDSGATAVDVVSNDDDIDAGPMTITGVSDPTNGSTAITGGGTGLTYAPDSNYCNDPPGTTPDTFTYTLNSGGAPQTATVSMTVTCVNDAPAADDETFSGNDSAHGNTTLQVDDPTDDKAAPSTPHTEITGDLLDGDTDVDGPGPLTITPGTFATADGGSVTIEADGDFVFEPAASTSCTDASDSFSYTVEDSGTPEQTDTGQVTIAIAGCVWYVSNNATGNSGTSTAPFDTLAQAETASGSNHTVFVFDGDNTSTGYTTGFAMNAGERLIGEHEGLVVDPDQSGPLTADTLRAPNPGARPTLTSTNEDVVDLDDGNEVRGLVLDPQGTGGGIAGAVGDTGGGAIDDVNIVDTGVAGAQPGLELDGTTGVFAVSNLVVDNSAATSPPTTATGVRLNNAGTVTFASTGTISLTTAGAKALDVTGTGLGTSTFDDITVTGSSVGGVSLVNVPAGSTTFGDGAGTDLDLTTTSGADPAFRVSSGSAITVPAGGTANIRATGGPAVDVTGTAGAVLDLDDVDSTDSATDGINLAGLGVGTFAAASGDISGAAGISVDVDGGTGAITYPGTLGNGSGQTAEVTGRSGGVVTLSGPIADTNDTGGGIAVSGNTGGSTVFSNASKTLNTGTGSAVVMSSSDGHTLTLSGGGLDIDATSGNGLDATSSGTLNVTGAGNTIATTTGRALRVQDTDVGAGSPLTFQSIAANGAPTGILLSNTGTNPSLTVTGTGGTCTNANTTGCTGGEIRNGAGGDSTSATPDGTGIVLNNTIAPSFTRMHLHDHANYAIRGSGVSGFTLANSVINGTNGTSDVTNDSSVYFNNAAGTALAGSASVSNTHIQGGLEDNFRVSQTSGTLNRLTFDTVTIGANSTALGNDGISIEGLGTSTMNVTVQGSALTSARGDLFQMTADGSGGGDLDFTGNALSNNHPSIGTGGGGVSLFGGAAAGATFDVTMSGSNTFRDAVGHAILMVKSQGSGSMTGSVNGITVGQDTAGDNSGSLEGSGIKLQHAGGGGTASVDITNSTFREFNNLGIEIQSGAGVVSSGTLSTNVTGNTVTDPGSNPSVTGFQGIALNSGVTPSDTFSSCLHLKGNTVAGAGSTDTGADDIRVRARQSTTVTIPGYAGGLTDTAAIAAFLAGQNDGVPNDPAANAPVPTASATRDAGASYSAAGTTCP
ncbi:Ig-like domain-containing protein [Nocardioides sp.]|uniref:Ig-like domain-containing protein n=1 Tax=Nocardioides sp. TaxID=35761 RepID=UPI001A19C80A|nr:Ig-like domain-containing protein [Nocardioides sp.]MBJ7358040.1 tandem-95 repeat protein [Nocardioides sp.]